MAYPKPSSSPHCNISRKEVGCTIITRSRWLPSQLCIYIYYVLVNAGTCKICSSKIVIFFTQARTSHSTGFAISQVESWKEAEAKNEEKAKKCHHLNIFWWKKLILRSRNHSLLQQIAVQYALWYYSNLVIFHCPLFVCGGNKFMGSFCNLGVQGLYWVLIP